MCPLFESSGQLCVSRRHCPPSVRLINATLLSLKPCLLRAWIHFPCVCTHPLFYIFSIYVFLFYLPSHSFSLFSPYIHLFYARRLVVRTCFLSFYSFPCLLLFPSFLLCLLSFYSLSSFIPFFLLYFLSFYSFFPFIPCLFLFLSIL